MSKKTILITGASSGIGAELARQHAGPEVRLVLTARSAERLADVQAAVEAKGAEVIPKVIDVTEREALATWLTALNAETPVDLVYANAGIADGVRRRAYEPEALSRALFDTNLYGVMNTIYPLLPGMQARKRGQIAIISSLAGYGAVASTPGYAGSKAAVRVWGESMRFGLARLQISLTVVCPGFIKTPLTKDNRFPMPFLLETPRAARLIIRGVAAGRRRVAFPWPLALMVWFLHALPPAWSEPLIRRALPAMQLEGEEPGHRGSAGGE